MHAHDTTEAGEGRRQQAAAPWPIPLSASTCLSVIRDGRRIATAATLKRIRRTTANGRHTCIDGARMREVQRDGQ